MNGTMDEPLEDGNETGDQSSTTKEKRKSEGSKTGQTEGKRKSKKTTTMTLRDLEVSARHFWKKDISEQLAQVVLDNRGMGKQRKLPGNELTAMALNEVAAEHGKGFFFHMLTREAWTSWPGEEFHPRSRVPKIPGSRFPALLYMNYTWTEKSRQAFVSDTHRGRYLKSDVMINPPESPIPLYAMQYVSANTQALYKTPTDSLILLATKNSYYLIKTSELEQIGGMWPAGKRSARGAEPEKRLNTVPFVWDTSKDPDRAEALLPYRSLDMEELYQRIVTCCSPTDLPSTFVAGSLAELIPRPSSPESGTALGMAHDDHRFQSAYPVSRRGAKKPRKRAKREEETDQETEDDE